MAEQKRYTWRDPGPLSRVVVLWLYLDMAAQILGGLAAWIHLADVRGLDPGAPADTLLDSDLPVGAIWLVYLVVALTSGFLILKWIYRISRNAHASTDGLSIRPPWAVGWFFVPVASLWKPFQGMREAWQVGVDRANWRIVPVPNLLRWWWGLYLVTNYLGWTSARLSFGAETLAQTQIGDWLDLLTLPLSLALDLVFLRIIRQMAARQAVDPGQRLEASAIAAAA